MAPMTACIAEAYTGQGTWQVTVLKKEMGIWLQAVLRDVTPSPKGISAPCSEFKADYIQVACLFFHQTVRDG